jgi:tripartite-type tricarboxylate transporter receptor subunit TctC
MKILRREFLRLAAGTVALPALSRSVRAQNHPTRPLRLVVGFPPGGAGDILARFVAQWLQEGLGQSVIVENKPGAGGTIAMESVARSPPDGHTLGLVGTAAAINVTLYEKLGYDFLGDIIPVASIARSPLVMLVNPSFPARGIPAFIAYAKASPGTINMGSGGSGTPSHVSGELFKMLAGVDMVHVPYRGSGPALNDLIGEQVQVLFDPVISSAGHLRAGSLRALGVTAASRSELVSGIPAVSEFVPGYEATIWNGIGAPRGTPIEIIGRINEAINAVLSRPDTKARLAELGSETLAGSPAEFGRLIAQETEKWSKVVKLSGARPD